MSKKVFTREEYDELDQACRRWKNKYDDVVDLLVGTMSGVNSLRNERDSARAERNEAQACLWMAYSLLRAKQEPSTELWERMNKSLPKETT